MAYTRFRRSIGLGAGVRLNVNKRSLGLSFGVPGARLSLNTDGRRTASIGVPGSGLYFVDSKKIGGRKRPPRPRRPSVPAHESTVHWLEPGDADALIPQAGFLASEPERRFRDGVVAYVRGDWSAATAAFEQAVATDAGNVSDEFFLGATYFIRGLDAAAVGPLEHVVGSAQDLPDDFMRKFVPGPIQLRVAVTNRVTALAPFSSLGASLMLAEVYQRLGRLEEAIGVVQRLAELAPDEPMLTLSLGDLFLEDGDFDAVVAVAGHLRGSDPASADAQRLVQIAKSARTKPGAAKRDTAGSERLEQLAQRAESVPAPVEAKPRSVRVPDSVGTAPQDQLTGLPLPGPGYPVSWAWKPGESPLQLDRASSRLSTPLAADMAFIFVDMLGVHRLAERLSWGYGNAIIPPTDV